MKMIYTFMVVSPHLHGESSYLGHFGIFFRVFYAQSLLVGGFNQFFQGSDPPLAKKNRRRCAQWICLDSMVLKAL